MPRTAVPRRLPLMSLTAQPGEPHYAWAGAVARSSGRTCPLSRAARLRSADAGLAMAAALSTMPDAAKLLRALIGNAAPPAHTYHCSSLHIFGPGRGQRKREP